MPFNLTLAWLWIVLGFVAGSIIGFNFNFLQEGWLGGYPGPTRRLYRLGHIAFFGLGLINLMFYLTVQALGLQGTLILIAAWALVIGAVTMPICCFMIPHVPRLRNAFYLPVASLIVGGVLVFWEVMGL